MSEQEHRCADCGERLAPIPGSPMWWCERCQKRRRVPTSYRDAERTWHDLSEDEQARVKRLLTPDPDDNLDDLLARMERAQQIIRGDDVRRRASERFADGIAAGRSRWENVT